MRLSGIARAWCAGLALGATTLGCQSAGWLRNQSPVGGESVTHRGQSIGSQLVLDGDFSFPPNDRLVAELVAQRSIINERLDLPPSDRKIQVHLYVDEESYRENLRRLLPAYPERRALFVETGDSLDVYAYRGEHVAIDLRHEVAHGYLHAAVPNLPLWLDEGLAEYFEVPRGQGGVNWPHVQLLRGQADVAGWTPDLARLEQLSDADAMTQLDYAESWLWVHFLLESEGEKSRVVQDYLAELRRGGQPATVSERLRRLLAHPAPAVLEHLDYCASDLSGGFVDTQPE